MVMWNLYERLSIEHLCECVNKVFEWPPYMVVNFGSVSCSQAHILVFSANYN